jgi:hypothetical protein
MLDEDPAESCYMCCRRATSREHVPPRCLFPEASECEGRSYRKSLLTVPSCDLHNSQKSADDEFLMVSLAGIIGNNSIGYKHKFSKVDRALRRSSYRLLDKIFTKRKEYAIEIENNEFLYMTWGTPDATRLQNCFDRIARGLHFHHFGKQLAGEISTYLGYLHPQEKNAATFKRFIMHRAEIDLRGKQPIGDNPEVFYYQVTDPDQFGCFLFHLRFYGGLTVYSAVVPSTTAKPSLLAAALIEKGIPTTVALEGETYEFNVDARSAKR